MYHLGSPEAGMTFATESDWTRMNNCKRSVEKCEITSIFHHPDQERQLRC